ITGAGGQLGSVLLRALTRRGASAVGTVSPKGPRPREGEAIPVDLARSDSLTDLYRRVRPRLIVHAAAVTSVQEAYRDPDRARRTNVVATRQLNELAADSGSRFVLISTDLVFDGTAAPYAESAPTGPTTTYGKTKEEAEQAVADTGQAVVLRLPL